MQFILNEESLTGQFESVEAFLQSLKNNIRCFQIIKKQPGNDIYKTQDFYKCNITNSEQLCDLKKYSYSDELLRFQMQLEDEIYTDPYWDDTMKQNLDKKYICNGKNVVATALAEAVEHNWPLLSFEKEEYIDCDLHICKDKKDYIVKSIYSPRFLVQLYQEKLKLDRMDILKIRYEKTRVDCNYIEKEYGPDLLQDQEFELLLGTLDKFVKHESWNNIERDDGLEYKKYHGMEQYFKGYNKTIMKFRFSDVMRVYGYRRKDQFRILRLERDHKMSNKG